MLADVFKKFIRTCLKYYELDPCHYFSAPGLSWDAMLKMTGIKLEKISDMDQYLFIEKGTRDEISYIAKRYARANNKYMSDYDSNKIDKYDIKVDDVKKLIPNLGNKNKYVLHYKNLQLYLSLGTKLTKIHRVLQFKRSYWIKKYIHFNTEKRENAANEFEKDFFKLMINSVYGKTMENLRKRINVRFVNNKKDFLKYTSKPTYVTHKLFNKNFTAIHEIKPVLILNKPIYVGFTVLDLSKWLMHDFHYNFIKKTLVLNYCLLIQTV